MASFAALLAGPIVLAAGIAPASAIEAAAAVEALGKALTAGSNMTASYESVDEDGANVVVHGFKLAGSSASSDASESVTFETVTIAEPAEGDSGIFQSPSITFSGGTISGSSGGSIATAVARGVTVLDPKDVRGGGPGSGLLYETGEASGIRITKSGRTGEVKIGKVSAAGMWMKTSHG